MDKNEWRKIPDYELISELRRRLKAGRRAQIEINKLASKNGRQRRRKTKPNRDVYERPIRGFDDLSNRAKNALLTERISFPALKVFRDVTGRSLSDLRSRPNIGAKTAAEIRGWVEKYGYRLREGKKE